MGTSIGDDGFNVQVKDLQELIDPKDIKKYLALGGLDGLRQKLRTDTKVGLGLELDESSGDPPHEEPYGNRKKKV